MTGTLGKVVADIERGKRAPVYLLVGDEFLAREGAKAIVGALVPEADRALSVETVGDEDAASVAGRLRMVPLFGGLKVVVVYDTKAFVSKQNTGQFVQRSREAWKKKDYARALHHLAQALAAAGQDRSFVERAATGEVSEAEWEQSVGLDPEEASQGWLQDTCIRFVAEGAEIEPGGAGATAKLYEDLLGQGIPAGAVWILTAEVVDQRRALFKRIDEAGVVVNCGVRTGKPGETQMKPEVARARIQEVMSRAAKRIDGETTAAIVERTGFSVRALDSELEKILLYVGDRAEVRRADVLAVLSNTREASIFDLTSAIEERDAGGAIRALRALAAQREAAQLVLGMIARTVRNLILARCALDVRLEGTFEARMPYARFQARILPRLVAEDGPDDGSAAQFRGMHPFRAFNLVKSASRFKTAELVAGLSAIHEADLALKTTGQSESVILESLALTLCRGAGESP